MTARKSRSVGSAPTSAALSAGGIVSKLVELWSGPKAVLKHRSPNALRTIKLTARGAWDANRRSLAIFLLLSAALSSTFAQQPTPLIHAHAHNDYEHTRPLLDALDHGFCSVEADIYLVDGKLLVAHDRSKVKPERTLQALYLDPLRERVKRNGGRVYPNGPEFMLLIDLKSDWKAIYPVLRTTLTNYADVLTTFHDDTKQTNAILAIISGSRDRAMFAGETTRYAAFDGELNDLDSNPSPNFAPWISASWGSAFRWRGAGAIPDTEAQKLRSIVNRAHEQGRRVRFWGAPDNANFWQAMLAAGVDLINTDDLVGLGKFFGDSGEQGSQRPTPGPPGEGNWPQRTINNQLSTNSYFAASGGLLI